MNYKFQNGDIIQCDLRTIFPNATVTGQYFEDDEGNVEIYIPENEYHTSFCVKLPKNKKGIDINGFFCYTNYIPNFGKSKSGQGELWKKS